LYVRKFQGAVTMHQGSRPVSSAGYGHASKNSSKTWMQMLDHDCLCG